MPSALYAPRVNNNDDFVQVNRILPAPGDAIRRGDIIAEIETDKSVLEIEAETDGYVIAIQCEVGQTVAVGSVMMWIGASPDEPVPDAPAAAAPVGSPRHASAEPTAKARTLLERHGLDASAIPAAGERLTAREVEAWVAKGGSAVPADTPTRGLGESPAPAPGHAEPWSPAAHGMARTVLWHRDEAVPAYLDIEYDPAPWNEYAARYMQERKLMMSPALALLAHRLVGLAQKTPRLNSTVVDGDRYLYDQVNLGFTVQAGDVLYLAVVQQADELDAWEFVQGLGELQRRAMVHKLRPDEARGATVSFSSMARWKVRRHVPVLPPWTSLIVAHAAASESGSAVLGATYDHRVLGGGDVAAVLEALTQPPKD